MSEDFWDQLLRKIWNQYKGDWMTLSDSISILAMAFSEVKIRVFWNEFIGVVKKIVACSYWDWSQGGGCCPSKSRTPSSPPSCQPPPSSSSSYFSIFFLTSAKASMLFHHTSLTFCPALIPSLRLWGYLPLRHFSEASQTLMPWKIRYVSHDVQQCFCSENETFILIWLKAAWWQSKLVCSENDAKKGQIHTWSPYWITSSFCHSNHDKFHPATQSCTLSVGGILNVVNKRKERE